MQIRQHSVFQSKVIWPYNIRMATLQKCLSNCNYGNHHRITNVLRVKAAESCVLGAVASNW